ncbi:unnamed protein product [Urochloa humidicola]
MAWKHDYTITSDELWDANPPNRLPRGILMFPQVDVDKTHVVHFLFIEFGYVKKKMWTVSIDMNTKTVESFSLYINGHDGLQTDDADLIIYKSMTPMPFLPWGGHFQVTEEDALVVVDPAQPALEGDDSFSLPAAESTEILIIRIVSGHDQHTHGAPCAAAAKLMITTQQVDVSEDLRGVDGLVEGQLCHHELLLSSAPEAHQFVIQQAGMVATTMTRQ